MLVACKTIITNHRFDQSSNMKFQPNVNTLNNTVYIIRGYYTDFTISLQAVQLIRAVSVLLKFNRDEQQLVHETLEWKMSWFGTRPKLGKGQMAKIIPPSY